MAPAQARGVAYGLAAAALFGVSAPLAKRLLPEIDPLLFAALLYLGGGIGVLLGGAALRGVRPGAIEAPLRRSDAPGLVAIIALGGIAGPLLMLAGLARLTGLSASLLLNLEGPFTVLVALILFREHLGRRGLVASGLVFAGSAVVGLSAGPLRGNVTGALFIAAACLAWAVDNNLTQRLSIRDPVRLVVWKGLGAGGAMLAAAVALGRALPEPSVAAKTLLLGAASYGVSILLDTYALRLLGAAREAALFATAPFLGAIAAIPILGEWPRSMDLLGGGAIALGVVLLVRERHSHLHTHAPLHHDHLHTHDEHHQHAHPGPVSEPHSHPHDHEPLTHEHPHASDAHHRHRH